MRIKIVLCMIDFTGCYNEYVLLQISGTFDIKNMQDLCFDGLGSYCSAFS